MFKGIARKVTLLGTCVVVALGATGAGVAPARPRAADPPGSEDHHHHHHHHHGHDDHGQHRPGHN
jgi:hypothetical protein